MNLKRLLTTESILPNLKPGSKEEVIRQIVDFVAYSGKISDKAVALDAILTRESKMSTGMQNGIAIPHGKTDTVDQLVAVVAICKEGTEFDAMDGKPVHIFILTLSPATRAGPHIQFLAEISKVLSRPELTEQLIAATTTPEILSLLTS